MEETETKIEESGKRSRSGFWFLVALSLLLVVVFVYYLPLRFENQAGRDHDPTGMVMDDGIMEEEEEGHAHHALPDSSLLLAQLPLRTVDTRVDSLPFTVLENGVKEFKLEASEFRWEYEPGSWVHVWGYNGQIPGPEIRVTDGDRVRVVVTNKLPDATTVHWHGVDLEWQADGVPNVTQKPIGVGETYVYEFTAKPAGTRFYHAHGKDHTTGAQQLDMGLSGAFIVEPTEETLVYDKEYTLVLDEWNILDGVNSALTHIHGAATEGAVPEFNTFTINGRIFPYIDNVMVEEGEVVRVRFINAGTSAFHPMHLHGHSFEVAALDGFVVPEAARDRRNTITVHPGETVDILIYADNPGPWLFHCHHVHHAAAGMITLFQYNGYEPVGQLR